MNRTFEKDTAKMEAAKAKLSAEFTQTDGRNIFGVRPFGTQNNLQQ